jgi:hypothetical protein
MSNRVASLGPYVHTEKLFKCPSDRSRTTLADGQSYPRVRSYSMNGTMGTRILWGSGGEIFLKMDDGTDLTVPAGLCSWIPMRIPSALATSTWLATPLLEVGENTRRAVTERRARWVMLTDTSR